MNFNQFLKFLFLRAVVILHYNLMFGSVKIFKSDIDLFQKFRILSLAQYRRKITFVFSSVGVFMMCSNKLHIQLE